MALTIAREYVELTPQVIDFKVGLFRSRGRLGRALQSAGTFVLPGDTTIIRHPGRSEVYQGLTPGGSSAGGLGRRIGGGRTFHCPAGYENGGRFTNRSFSNCGARLFEAAVSALTDTAAGAVGINGRRRRGSGLIDATTTTGRTIRGDRVDAPVVQISRSIQIPEVRAFSRSARNSGIIKAAGEVSGFDKQQVRLVRRDGVILTPVVSLQKLQSVRKSRDMDQAALVVNAPKGEINKEALALALGNNVSSVIFSLPGKTTFRIDRESPITPSRRNAILGAWEAARANSSGAEALKEIADATEGLSFGAKFDIPNANERLSVHQGDKTRNVPRWVYELYLSSSAPFRGGRGTWEIVTSRTPQKSASHVAGAIARTDQSTWTASIAFKTMAYTTASEFSSFAIEMKRVAAVWDADLPPKGGYRCPPGTRYGGRITDRFGRNCGWNVSRRLANRLQTIGQAAGQALDSSRDRRVARRLARGERRVARRTERAARRADVAARLEGFADRVANGEKKPRKIRGAQPRRRDSIADRLDRFADRVADRKKKKPKKGKKPLADRLDDFADRVEKKPKRNRTGSIADRVNENIAPRKNVTRTPGKPSKKVVPGKQFGGTYKVDANVRKTAYNAAIDNETRVYVAKNTKGNLVAVDGERLDALKYEPLYAFDKNGTLWELTDPDADAKDFIADVAVNEKIAEKADEVALIEPEIVYPFNTLPPPVSPAYHTPRPGKRPKMFDPTGPKPWSPSNPTLPWLKFPKDDPHSNPKYWHGYGKLTYNGPQTAEDEAAWAKIGKEILRPKKQPEIAENASEAVVQQMDDLPEDVVPKFSKTGGFLPDNLSEELLESYREGASKDFVTAFNAQQDQNLLYWNDFFAANPDYEFDAKTKNTILKSIDAAIKSEAEKTVPNQNKLGAMRAERANFLALSYLDGMTRYERFNYIQPKRRSHIIEDANLGELVVKPPKVKKATPAKPLTPEFDPKTEFNAWEASQAEQVAAHAKEIADKWAELDFKNAYLNDADGELSMDTVAQSLIDLISKNNDLREQMLADAVDSKSLDIDLGEDYLFNSAVIKALDSSIPKIAQKIQDKNFETHVADPESPALDAPSVNPVQKFVDDTLGNEHVVNAYKKDVLTHKNDIEQDADGNGDLDSHDLIDLFFDNQVKMAQARQQDAQTQLSKDLAAGEMPDPWVVMSAHHAWGTIEDWAEKRRAERHADLDQHLNKQKAEAISSAMDQSYGDFNWVWTASQEGDDNWTVDGYQPGKQMINQIEANPDSLYFFQGKQIGLTEANALWNAPTPEAAQEALDEIPPAEAPEIANLSKVSDHGAGAALTHLFEATPEFNFSTLAGHEGQRVGNTLDSIIARQDSKPEYVGKIDEVLTSLPEDFDNLTPEEKIAALNSAAKTTGNLQAAKEIARSIFTNQYGRPQTLKDLRAMLDVHSGKKPFSSVADMDFDKMAEAATVRFDEAQKNLEGLSPSTPEAVKMFFKGEVADARSQYVTALLGQHNKVLNENPDNIAALSSSAKAIANEATELDDVVRKDIESRLNKSLAITSGNPDKLSSKGALPTAGFDSSLAGSMSEDGKAIAYTIPVGHKGIWTKEDAAAHLTTGGNLVDIPDVHLKEAVVQNMGGRFKALTDHSQGYNESFAFIDTLNNKRYVIKSAHRNHMEHVQELAGARLAQVLGEPTSGIRLGTALYEDANLPGPQKSAEGVKTGLQRAILLDTVHNMFDGDGYTVYDSFYDVPAGSEFDGESIARMMVLDRTMNYFDRTAANMIPVKGPDGKVRLMPIDHGNAFRGWGGSVPEEQAGFVAKTKGDNIDLAALAAKLSPEEKNKFAAAMSDAVKRYQKADFSGAFGEIADRMNLTKSERDRLEAHADFLENRKASLNWEKMQRNMFTNMGFSDQEAEDLLNPPQPTAAYTKYKGLVVPPDAPTIGPSLAKAAESAHEATMYIPFSYDGGDIEHFEVRSQQVDYKDAALGIADFTDSTVLTFKRRGKAAKVKPSEADGWTKVTQAPTPVRKNIGEKPRFDPDSYTDKANVPGSAGVITWRKKLDDGTVVMVTTTPAGNAGKNSSNQLSRIIMPGNAGSNLNNQERVRGAMEALGIKQHGLPTQDDVRTFGIQAAGASLLGHSHGGTTQEVEDKLKNSFGITAGNLRTVIRGDGKMFVEFDEDAVEKIKQVSGVSAIHHNFAYGSNPPEDTIVSSLAGGGYLSSTTTRYNHGVAVSGASSDSDAGTHGSGDYVFAYRAYNKEFDTYFEAGNTSHYSPSTFVTPVSDAYARTDWYALTGDNYGEINNSSGVIAGHAGQSASESMFRTSMDLTRGLIVVNQTMRDSIIKRLGDMGITSVRDIPLDEIVVTGVDYAEKAQKLLERLSQESVKIIS